MKNNKILLKIFLASISLITLINSKSDFYEISKLKKHQRVAKSNIVQFCYTSDVNIGDYLPTLGMWKMLNKKTDIWSIKDRNIDFNFINKNYKYGIIGGAGILSKRSQHFYEDIIKKCKIPLIIWGVGICLPRGAVTVKSGIDQHVINKLEKKCDLINVRDILTKELYKLKKAYIAPCPTIVYLQKFKNHINPKPTFVTYASHDKLVPKHQDDIIKNILKNKFSNLNIINNTFHSSNNKTISEIDTIIKNYYCNSKIVVTTRLHGAIIAYSLGIPYIAIAYDDKLLSFHKTYGNGIVVNNPQELQKLLNTKLNFKLKPIQLPQALKFGNMASSWASKK